MKLILSAWIGLIGLWSTSAETAVRWADVYKSGPLKIQPDPSFGKGVDWGGFLFESYKDIVVADDGTMFMANSREHTIHKFDPAGRLVLTFGKRGQGPGDLESPGSPSLLDGKYLVVSEYATSQRISLFDLNGRFYKLLKTQRPVHDMVALAGTKIAYLSQQFEAGGTAAGKTGAMSMPSTIRVIIKDIENGNEQVILTRKMQADFIRLASGMTLSFGNDQRGNVFIARSGDGNLAVGVSNSPNIEIFDLEGKPLRSFSLKGQARPATPDYIARFKKTHLAGMQTQSQRSPSVLRTIGELESIDYAFLFDRTLPYYADLLTDADGNFLFFSYGENPGQSAMDFSVYSPQGQFLGETRLDPEAFDIEIDRRCRRLCFAKAGLIGLAPLKTDEDKAPILFRVVPNPTSRPPRLEKMSNRGKAISLSQKAYSAKALSVKVNLSADREFGIPNSPDTKYKIGSITKIFTAVLAMKLAETGTIDLDRPVSAYITEFPKKKGEKITVRHLLNHTSGINEFDPGSGEHGPAAFLG